MTDAQPSPSPAASALHVPAATESELRKSPSAERKKKSTFSKLLHSKAKTPWFRVVICHLRNVYATLSTDWVSLSFAETKVLNFFLVWDRSLRTNYCAKRLKPCFRPIIPSHWQTQKFHMLAFIFCVFFHGSYYTTLSFDIIRDVFVLFTFAKVEVIWFDTLVSYQSLALLQVLHIMSPTKLSVLD